MANDVMTDIKTNEPDEHIGVRTEVRSQTSPTGPKARPVKVSTHSLNLWYGAKQALTNVDLRLPLHPYLYESWKMNYGLLKNRF